MIPRSGKRETLRKSCYGGAMRVHLVDGTFELYRAHFAPRPGHRAPDGRDIKATVGLVASLAALLRDPEEGVTHLAVAFDNPIRSFRNDLFPAYKSDEGVPPELRSQFDSAERAVAALGVVVWSMREFEADDALATAARRFSGAAEQVRILSPDKDLGQCLRADTVVQVDRIRRKTIDLDAFRVRWGIAPTSMPDLLALVGDSADGLPGVPGFGLKTAAALLARYVHLDEIPLDGTAWPSEVRGAKRLSAALREHLEAARLYRRLATLRDDVPLEEDLEVLRYRGPSAGWAQWCEETGRPEWRDLASMR